MQPWINISANNPSVRVAKREAIEGVSNGIAWFEIVGMYESSTEIPR